MPTYNVKNLKTGETKEFRMTMKEYCQWKEDNPDWDKDWSAGIAGTTYGGQSNPMDSKRSCRRCKRSIQSKPVTLHLNQHSMPTSVKSKTRPLPKSRVNVP